MISHSFFVAYFSLFIAVFDITKKMFVNHYFCPHISYFPFPVIIFYFSYIEKPKAIFICFPTSIMAPVRGTMRQAGRSLSCITSAGADGQRDAPVIVRHRNISGAKRTKEKKLEEINESEGERTGGEKGSIGTVEKKGIKMEEKSW